jgi:DNA polymerase-1
VTAAPLLAVDAPSLLYRAFFALPSSIRGTGGRPVNALLGTTNLVLQAVERFAPRAVVMCHGAEAGAYRTSLWPAYHADRPPMPDELAEQWEDAGAYFAEFGWPTLHAGDLEADDLLGTLARLETEAGGRAVLFTGDRDMFQCASESVTVLYPGGKDGPTELDAAAVRARYGVDPGQVPDFIALRGDPSDGLPGAKGIGEKTAATLLQEHGSLEALLVCAADDAAIVRAGLRPRVVAALCDQADELRAFRDIATLRDVPCDRPADGETTWARAAQAAEERGMARLAERLRGLAA